MNIEKLKETAAMLVAGDRGLLAMDESSPTIKKRFEKIGIADTEEARRSYREMILTTPDLGEAISGVILFDETIHQKKKDGTPFINVISESGIIPGIKVDKGTKEMEGHPGEKVTEGLDGLDERLVEYAQMGARFAKWRAVFKIGEGIPSRDCIEANSEILAQYAVLCQQNDIVPIVEPEVLMDGDHTLEQCYEVTDQVLHAVFNSLSSHGVVLEGMLLKPNMIVPGLSCPIQEPVNIVADATITCLMHVVPSAVPAICFLSGGQSAELASARLNAINLKYKDTVPWALTFSFARAIQTTSIEIWKVEK